jgi:membrane protease YdiL (CAAX protease family)
MKTISKPQSVKWIILTIICPLALSLLAANFYIAFWYMRMAMAGTPHEGAPLAEVIQQGMFFTGWSGLWFTVLLWWFLKRKYDSFATLFNTKTEHFRKDLFAGVLVGGFWVIIYGLIGWPPFSEMFVFDLEKLASLPTSLSAGFCEEFLFRGFVVLMIARAGGNKKHQIIWSSLAFGMAHILWGPWGVFFTVLIGVSFAMLTIYRGNAWPAVVAHSLLNICIEPGLIEKAINMRT